MKRTRSKPQKAVLGLVFVCAFVAVVIGAAQYLRGPVSTANPEITSVSVQLEDGRIINVQTREVTVAEWQSCHHAGQCMLNLSSGAKTADYPATGLSFPDAVEFISWLNDNTQHRWRLPTSAEWFEIAAEVLPQKPDPIFTDPALTWASAYFTQENRSGRTLRPSGTFAATSDGVEDLSGNVWEWTQDCYAGASGQGDKIGEDRCPAYIMGGEHEAVMPYLVRDPSRGGCAVGAPPAHLGMRLVSDTQ